MPWNNCSSSWSAAAFALLVTATIPAVSRAQTCASNADCTAGLTCQLSAVPPQPTVDPSCLKGQTCTGTGAEGKVSAAVPVQSITTCQVAPCKVDGDCAAGMVCHAEKSVSCSGGGASCPANTVCDVATTPAPPDSCVETTVSTCAFKWQLPCNTDQDCGGEFVCSPSVSGTCSSGTGVASPGSTSSGSGTATPVAGDAPTGSPVAIPPAVDGGTGIASDGGTTTCTTTTSFPGYCQPKTISCAVDADCPTWWTCAAAPVPVTQGAPPVARDGAGGSPSSTTVAEVPVSAKLCQPPGQYPVRGSGGVGIAIDGKETTPTGSNTGGQPPTVAGAKTLSGGASAAGGGGCSLAGAGGSAEVPLLGSVLLGLVVAARLKARRQTTRRNR